MIIRSTKLGIALISFTLASVVVPAIVGTDAGAAIRTSTAKFCKEAKSYANEDGSASASAAQKAVNDLRKLATVAPSTLKGEMLTLANDVQNVVNTGHATKKQAAAVEKLDNELGPQIKSKCGGKY